MPKGKQGFQKGHKFFGDLSKPNYFQKGDESYWKGKKLYPEAIEKMVLSRKGKYLDEENGKWKGDKVTYAPLHIWVKKRKGSPRCCEHCGKIGKKEGRAWNIEWANVDHKYHRVLEDYIGLCKKCHAQYDIKNKYRFINNNKQFYGLTI